MEKRTDRRNLTMDKAPSEFPDKLLRLSQALPWPVNSATFNVLRRFLEARGRATGALTRIRFGKVKITAPLEHPAVYWRYRPVGLNRNYLLLVKRVLASRTGLIIDVGANIGDGIALIRGAGLNAPVLAIEGADVWFNLLRANMSDFSDVALERVFLGTVDQESHLVLHVQDGTSKLISGDSTIEITSLDTLLQRHTEYPVVLLKTDTDGFDAKVLFGARSLLTEQKPVLFVEVDEGLMREQGDSTEQLLSYLSECGYSSVGVWNNLGRWLSGALRCARASSRWHRQALSGCGSLLDGRPSYSRLDPWRRFKW
jgi:FkbM family methyltransferase